MNKVKDLYYYLRVNGNRSNTQKPSVIKFCHLVLVIKGHFTYFANNKEYTVSDFDVLLLPPNTLRQKLPYTDQSEFVIFNFEIEDDIKFYAPTVFKNAVSPTILSLLNLIPCTFYCDSDAPYDFFKLPNQGQRTLRELNKTKGFLHNVLNCILIELFDSLEQKKPSPYVTQIIKYINDNITKNISLDDICNQVHLSKEYTARIFKNEMGITITNYINHQKLSYAKTLLASGDYDLQSVSETVGYQNYHYFSRLFKQYFGVTPISVKNKEKKSIKATP